MTPERYRQVNALAEAALEMGPDRRTSFLDEVCASDPELRMQIESLLDADSHCRDFLEQPLVEVLAGEMLLSPAEHDHTGRRLGNYKVLSRLGTGGMGEVWLARDLKLNREIALKLLSPRLAGDPSHMRRFQQEARAPSMLNHPNIITVYEIGEIEGTLFIAEERVEGETLRQRLTRGPIPILEILAIATQAATALRAAHSAGIVHRDIKPENIMIRPDGLVKLLDFGLARFAVKPASDRALSQASSQPGLLMGTVRYMSPEQARGLPADFRSDIFSLGVVLYEMASGVPPFSGPTPTDTLAAILKDEPAPLSRHSQHVPATFEHIVRRCLAKECDARHASGEALGEDLGKLASHVVPQAPLQRWRIVAAVCAALAMLAFVYVLATRKSSEPAFNSMRITRLPTLEEAADAAISQDGKLIAYVAGEGSGQGVWIRNAADSKETALVPAKDGELSGVLFSPDNSSLYYRRKGAADDGELYRVPVKGRTPQRVIGGVSGAAALSPDGRRVAFVRLKPSTWEASIVVADVNGGGEFTLATLQRPRYFDQHSVAWSPDGCSIACFAGEAASYSAAAFQLLEIRLEDRSQHPIGKQSWSWPRSVAWSAKGDVLIVTAASQDADVHQLWMVQHRNGSALRLTNDLSNYDRVTITSDGNSLATVQSDHSAALWVLGRGEPLRINRAPLRSQRIAVTWTPDGHILYSDPAGDYRNLWLIDSDGANLRQVTSSPGNKDQVAVSRDGHYIVYKQSGNIWRVDSDGTHAQQLTHGALDVHPDVAADGRSVIYASFANWSPAVGGEPTLCKVPIDGGEPVEISKQPASYPRVSPDGTRLGFIHFPGKDPRFSPTHVGMLRLDGVGGFTVLEASPSDETDFSWSPDGKALDYIANVAGVGNIWRQPMEGGPAARVTNFASDELYAFSWSRDGKLVCARGTTTRGVVLIENFR